MRKYNLVSVMLGREGQSVFAEEGKALYIDEIGILHIRQPGAKLEQLEPPGRWYQALAECSDASVPLTLPMPEESRKDASVSRSGKVRGILR